MIPLYVKDHIRNYLCAIGNAGASVADIYDEIVVAYYPDIVTKRQIRDYLDYETQRNLSNIFKTTGSRPVTYCFLE